MRPLASRRLTALAISAAITLGTAGPAFADEHHPSRPATHAGDRALAPDAAALLTQAKALGDLGGVTSPVTELVAKALKADDGRIPAADAEALKAKIETAVDAAKAAAPAPVPEAPAAEVPVETPAVQTPAAETPAVQTPAAAGAGKPAVAGAIPAAPTDLIGDALATVQKAVADLLAAVTSLKPTDVVGTVTGTLTSLVNLVTATLVAGGLPKPDLPGLPDVSQLPVQLPADAPAAPPIR
ncbi:hypothetical protein ACFY7C_21535 [Streptomyces sp. NPDC012769]|uniref:hypothetical protein n=1 Tax=Streptomyces sp. NPDC012769 TaxID=3364848 RepID=UPI00368AEE5D